jgi:hypothetical protein
LNSPGGARGGLIPASIEIDNVSKIPANQLLGITDAQPDNLDLRGMVVYNTGTPTVPPGIYVWNGYSWTHDGNCIPIVTAKDSVHGVSSGESVALAVNIEGYPPFDIKWYRTTNSMNALKEFIYPPEPLGTDQVTSPTTYTDEYNTNSLSGTNVSFYYYCTVKSPYSDVLVYSDTIRVPVCNTETIPALDSIRGSAIGCVGTYQTYWVPKKTGVAAYHWEIPDDWEVFSGGQSGDTTITVRVKSAISDKDTIKVTPRNDCYVDGTTQTLA